MDYFSKTQPITPMACSSVRNGHFYGRNLDWIFNNQAEFVVRTKNVGARYGTIGIAGGISEFTEEFMLSRTYHEKEKLIPFMLYDGINDCGVVANMNVVPPRKGENSFVDAPYHSGKVPALMLVRYILDRFDTARNAVNYILNHVNIVFPKSLYDYGYELHYMVADLNDTFVIEVFDSGVHVLDISSKPYMTNFHLTGVRFNDDGTIYTPATQDVFHNAITTNYIHPHGSGLERYNLIVNRYPISYSKNGMRMLMNELTYTKAYSTSPSPSNPYWYTEFVGTRDLTVASTIEQYQPVVDAAGELYSRRSRTDGGKTWHTVHSAVYDIRRKKLYLKTQEEEVELNFKL